MIEIKIEIKSEIKIDIETNLSGLGLGVPQRATGAGPRPALAAAPPRTMGSRRSSRHRRKAAAASPRPTRAAGGPANGMVLAGRNLTSTLQKKNAFLTVFAYQRPAPSLGCAMTAIVVRSERGPVVEHI